MCRIEQFDVVYPDGFYEPREQLVPCHRGTRSQPCRGAEVVRVRDHLASASERPPIQPHIVPIEPSGLSRGRKRDPITGMTLNLKFWNPFSSKKKEKEKMQYYLVREGKRPRPCPPPYPPIPPPPEGPCVPPVPQEPQPSRPNRGRGRRPPPPPPITVHHSSEEDEEESSSPPEANREHDRRTRSLSSIRRYEAEKERIRQREFRERERRERNRREAREARDRAAIHERLEQQRARDEERARVASLERRERQREREERREERRERAAHLERLERQRERDEERERLERRQARLRERLAAEQEAIRQQNIRAQQLREDRARRHWEEEDRARRRWVEEERRRAADRAEERDRYRYAEQRRRERARQANIPLHPRHPVFVHHGNLDRGDRVIRDDIRAEFERRAERLHDRYDDGSLRRRNTIDGGRRWHDGYWRDRRY